MISYFASAFHNLRIVLVAMKNQKNIYSLVAKCLLNFAKKSCLKENNIVIESFDEIVCF